MVTNERTVLTTIVGSDDGSKTFEIKRIWDESKRIGIVITLYPTISAHDIDQMDLSTMHLLNHVRDFDWGGVRIINLFSKVFEKKPLSKDLCEDDENYQYIKKMMTQKEIADNDIVIGWGSGLSNNKETVRKKIEILELIQKKKFIKGIKCIETDYLEGTQPGVHPLYLGLHYSKEEWRLEQYPLEDCLVEFLDTYDSYKTSKKTVNEKEEEDVLQVEE